MAAITAAVGRTDSAKKVDGRRPGYRRPLMVLGACVLAAVMSSCVLWAETHFRVEQGWNTYVYIHVTPSNQMKGIAANICEYEHQCMGEIMRGIDIGNGFAQGWWNTAWSSPHTHEAVLQLSSAIGTSRCLTMVKLAIPQPTPVPGVTLYYRWQTRAQWDDGCRLGQPFG